MTNREIIFITEFLRKIQLSELNDKDIKKALSKNYTILFKNLQPFIKNSQELQNKLFSGKEKEIEEYNKKLVDLESKTLEEQESIIKTLDPEIKNLATEFNNKTLSMLNEDKNIELIKINKDRFIDVLVDANISYTYNDLVMLNSLYSE